MMTERTFSSPSLHATPIQSSFHAGTSASHHALVPAESGEEEPYTIKCICDYSDDDGNTIFCEKCDTWQHIECFYHGNIEAASAADFSHLCHECSPRSLDRRKATERQRQQRLDRPAQDNGEKKSKRPSSKSHKKKTKPSDLQTNGQHHDHDGGHKHGSPHEHSHSHKKSKSIHRSHHSISSVTTKQSPSNNNRNNNHAHPLSPATTPPDDLLLHSYSKQLQDLYQNDPGPQDLKGNAFTGLGVANAMSDWLHDFDKLQADTGVQVKEDAFQQMIPGFDFKNYEWPRLKINKKEIPADDAIIPLRYLSILEPLGRSQLVGELKGDVGLQKDYYVQETDHYAKLCHPPPFVFFPSWLPLYIDTRKEGNKCRYVRRSCQPNTTLEAYITNNSDYHFCIVSERPLVANEQVTLKWDFNFPSEHRARYEYLLGLAGEDNIKTDHDARKKEADVTLAEYEELTELIRNVLSEYGGCACGLENDCSFTRFYRNAPARTHAHSNGVKPKKSRKPKQHISPTSTGHATNSRDVSEGRQEVYDGEDDSRSNSGSTRSKPQSRDMTPFAAVDLHTTEREKRKINAVEKMFQDIDQAKEAKEKEGPPRKKKRTSDGSTVISPVTASNTQKSKKAAPRASVSNASLVPTNGSAARCKDASTSRQSSNSPTSELSPKTTGPVPPRPASQQPSNHLRSRQSSPSLRSNYVDQSTQTDEVENAWYSGSRTSTRKKAHIPLSKRLLNNQMRIRAERESRRTSQTSQPMEGVEISCLSNPSSPETKAVLAPEPTQAICADQEADALTATKPLDVAVESIDIPMPDAPPSIMESSIKPPPPPWSNALSPVSANVPPSVNHRTADMKAQMPPAPTFSNPSTSGTSTHPAAAMPSPNSVAPVAQSPLGSMPLPSPFSPSIINSVGQHPSPVRKKLSLNAYHAMKKKAPEATPSTSNLSTTDSALVSTTSQLSSSPQEEVKKPGVLESSTIIDSPVAEKSLDGLAAAGSQLGDAQECAATVPATQL